MNFEEHDFNGFQIASFDKIMRKEVKPMSWIIPELIPEGLTLFAGKQKMGKSFLALQISIGVANGGYVLGRFHLKQGGALYFALEDGERRIHDRGLVMANGNFPRSLDISYNTADIRNGGLDALRRYLDYKPHVKLVTYDIIGRAMRLDSYKEQRAEIYDALGPLQREATDRGIGIIAVHHMNQQSSESKLEDELDGVYGSGGYTQAPDTIIQLKRRRNSNNAILYVTGRDVTEHEYNLVWYPEMLTWVITGDGVDTGITDSPSEQDRFMQALNTIGLKATRKELAKELNKDENAIDQLIRRAKLANKITQDSGSGHFQLVELQPLAS